MEEKKIVTPKRKEPDLKDVTTCDSTAQMLAKARRDGVEIAFDRAANMKACPIGADSACCKHCAMGPCRLNARDPYSKVGVCGATIDTIMARNFGRMIAAGGAAHTDHGMVMLDLFREVVNGNIQDYQIKDIHKLESVAASIGIDVEGRSPEEIARALYQELERTYTQVEGEIPFAKRVPEKTLETWRKHGIVPRTALADGWGGSMVATEISDILFGTPSPVSIETNMGVLKEDQVNIIVHGHEPNLFESILESVNEPSLIEAAKKAGAKGLNLVGMCCSGLEMFVRHGLPHAGNFSSTEAILVTGAVDAFCVDVQCIKQGLAKVAECYGTPLITTNPRCKIEGALHLEFHEHDPKSTTDEIVIKAITRFKNRKASIEIPQNKSIGVHGFSHEYIQYMLGGTFRGSYKPLNDNIINGRIRGVAGVVGCTNPRVKQDWVHVELVKELIKNDVLVVQTGCSQIALAKAGLTSPEAAVLAGPGLREVCETVGMPPVLGIGACVDNSRILIACAEMVKTGGLGDSIAELPVAGAAPEYMSEKAICIGQYFVASGVYTVFGVTFPIVEGTKFHKHLFEELEELGFGKWGFATLPILTRKGRPWVSTRPVNAY
jgi:carbon-monoxide dehydrogenase catalytic subunit